MNEKELMEKLLQEDEQFRNTFKAHRSYENRVCKLEKKPHLSPEENIEKKRLKKLKLALKDQLQRMLSERLGTVERRA